MYMKMKLLKIEWDVERKHDENNIIIIRGENI